MGWNTRSCMLAAEKNLKDTDAVDKSRPTARERRTGRYSRPRSMKPLAIAYIYGRLHACVEATIIILISERLFLSAYIDFFVI